MRVIGFLQLSFRGVPIDGENLFFLKTNADVVIIQLTFLNFTLN